MILDQLIAIRILYLLVTPFKKQEAFKLGVIDENGDAKLAINDMNPAQKSSYTMLHRLCFRLKKVLAKIPFGKTTLASMAAAYVLVREHADDTIESENIEQLFEEKLSNLTLTESSDSDIDIENLFLQLENVLKIMSEEGVATNTTAGISASVNNTPVITRKQSVTISKDKFKLVKAEPEKNRRSKIYEFVKTENVDFVINEEDGECLVL